jgi:hypothetical protein
MNTCSNIPAAPFDNGCRNIPNYLGYYVPMYVLLEDRRPWFIKSAENIIPLYKKLKKT